MASSVERFLGLRPPTSGSAVRSSASFITDARTDGAANPCKVVLLTAVKRET